MKKYISPEYSNDKIETSDIITISAMNDGQPDISVIDGADGIQIKDADYKIDISKLL